MLGEAGLTGGTPGYSEVPASKRTNTSHLPESEGWQAQGLAGEADRITHQLDKLVRS